MERLGVNVYSYVCKITLAGGLLLSSLVATAGAESFLNGSAEISYTNFNAESNGKEVYSGDTLAQKYSVAWTSTNLYYRSQPRYYSVMLGYDWTSFNTNISDRGTDSEISQTFGKFRYNGEIGYSPVDQPIRFRAYADNGETTKFKTNIYNGLMDDGLTYGMDGLHKGYSTGFSFIFESDRATSAALRQLPRVYLDYRETLIRSVDIRTELNNKTSELSVAGLNKENNWLQYHNLKYENFLNSAANYEQQSIQVGLVDHVGRRKWAALTNWINVSVDGSFSNKKGNSAAIYQEEYDVNFYATATRRNWEARTLMNYNRELLIDRITEKTSVPVYVKGIWNSDIDWFANVSANRGRELVNSGRVDTSYANTVSLGANMFKRSPFTLSPSMSVTTSKSFTGGDAYDAAAAVNTSSTRYYSNKINLFGGYLLKLKDDGYGTSDSSSWSSTLTFKGDYMPTSQLSIILREDLEYGRGTGYLNTVRLNSVLVQKSQKQQYTHLVSYASLRYIGSSSFSSTLEGTHDYVQSESAPASSTFQISHNMYYTKNDLTANISTRYDQSDTNTTTYSSGQLQYRPNRYHDTTVRAYLDRNSNDNGSTTNISLVQNYAHNIYSRTGTMRNIATLSEEFSFTRSSVNSLSTDSKYLLLAGRYSPTERISLYGSLKYQDDPASVSMFYSVGAAMDFKLLTTTLDYYLAKRDSDNRIERKWSASVKRTF